MSELSHIKQVDNQIIFDKLEKTILEIGQADNSENIQQNQFLQQPIQITDENIKIIQNYQSNHSQLKQVNNEITFGKVDKNNAEIDQEENIGNIQHNHHQQQSSQVTQENENIIKNQIIFEIQGKLYDELEAVYDLNQKKFYAQKKYIELFHHQYIFQKRNIIELQSQLPNEQFYAKLIEFDDQNFLLKYELGDCSLQDLMDYMKTNNKKWQEDDIIKISIQLIDICLKLAKDNIFYSDWKPSNIIFIQKDNRYITNQASIKLIKFCQAIQNFHYIFNYTPENNISYEQLQSITNKQQRISIELYQIGKIIKQLIEQQEQSIQEILSYEQKEFQQILTIELEKLSKNEILSIEQEFKQILTIINNDDLMKENQQDLIYQLQIIQNWVDKQINQETQNYANLFFFKQIKDNKLKNLLSNDKLDLNSLEKLIKLYSDNNLYQQCQLAIEKYIEINKEIKSDKIIYYLKLYLYLSTSLNQFNIELFQNEIKEFQQDKIKESNENECIDNQYASNKFFKNVDQQLQYLSYLGLMYYQQNKFQQAQEKYCSVIEIAQKEYGNDHPFLAKYINNLGVIYKEQRKFKEAIDCYCKSIELSKKALLNYRCSYLSSKYDLINNKQDKLNEVLSQQKYYQITEKKYFEIRRINYSSNHFRDIYVTTVNNLVNINLILQKLNDAEENYYQVRQFVQNIFEKNNYLIASILGYLGIFYKKQGKLEEADNSYRRLINIMKNINDEDHYSLLYIIIYNLSTINNKQQQSNEKDSLFQKAIKNIQQNSINDNLILIDTLSNFDLNDQELLKQMNKYYQSVINMIKQNEDNDFNSLANNIDNLTLNDQPQSNLNQVDQLYCQIIEQVTQQNNTIRIIFVNILNEMGIFFKLQGKQKQAEQQFLIATELEINNYDQKQNSNLHYIFNFERNQNQQKKIDEVEEQYDKVIELINKYKIINNPILAGTIYNLIRIKIEQKQYKQAQELSHAAIELTKKSFGESDPYLVTIIYILGNIYQEQTKLQQAEEQFLIALELLNKYQNTYYPFYVDILYNLGEVYNMQGKLLDTQKYYNQSIQFIKMNYDNRHPLLIKLLQNLGITYQKQKRYIEALQQYQIAIELYQKNNKDLDHNSYIHIIGNIGNIYVEQGKFFEAEKQYLRAIEINKNKYNKDHYTIIPIIFNYGLMYHKYRFFQQAENQYCQAIKIMKMTQENETDYIELQKLIQQKDCPSLQTIIFRLGFVYQQQDYKSQADNEYAKIVQSINNDKMSSANMKVNQGMAYKEQSQFKEAEEQYIAAIDIKKQINGINTLDLANDIVNLGNILYEQERYSEAKKKFKETIKIIKNEYGNIHPSLADPINSLSLTYLQQKKFNKFQQYYSEFIELVDKNQDIDRNIFINFIAYQAQSYQEQGNYTEAEQQYNKAIDLIKNYNKQHPILVKCYYNVGLIYQKQKKNMQAVYQYRKACEIANIQNYYNDFSPVDPFINLALIYQIYSKENEVLKLYQRATEFNKITNNHNRISLVTAFNNMGIIHQQQWHYQAAIFTYMDVLYFTKKDYIDDLQYRIIAHKNLAQIYQQQLKFRKAERHYCKAIEIIKKVNGENHDSLNQILTQLNIIQQQIQQDQDQDQQQEKKFPFL